MKMKYLKQQQEEFKKHHESIHGEETELNVSTYTAEYMVPYSDEKTYLALVDHVINHGFKSEDRTGTGTRSVFGAHLKFDLSKGKIPVFTTKKINPAAPKLEMDWMMSGNTNIKWLQERGIRIWDDWTKKGEMTESSPVRLVENKTPTQDLAELAATMMNTDLSADISGDLPAEVSETTHKSYARYMLYSRYMDHTMYSINKHVHKVPDEDNKYKPIALLKKIGCLGLSKELQDFKTFCKFFNKRKFVSSSGDAIYATSTYHGEKIITPENIKFATDKVIRMWHKADTQGYWKDYIEHFFPSGESWVYHFTAPYIADAELIKPEAGDKLLRHMETDGDVGPIYGESWRSFKTGKVTWGDNEEPVDQLKAVIEELKANRRSRRHLLLAWNPMRVKDMGLPPCHVLVQFYVSPASPEEQTAYSNYASPICGVKPPEWKLSLTVYFRSNDLGLGTPYNIMNYSSMLINIACVTGMIPGDLHLQIGDAHVYENHIEGLSEQLKREPYGFPDYRIITHDPMGNNGVGSTLFSVCDYKHHPFIRLPVAV